MELAAVRVDSCWLSQGCCPERQHNLGYSLMNNPILLWFEVLYYVSLKNTKPKYPYQQLNLQPSGEMNTQHLPLKINPIRKAV